MPRNAFRTAWLRPDRPIPAQSVIRLRSLDIRVTRADFAQIRRKLVIVGDGAAGKTSLLNVFAVGNFPENYVSSNVQRRLVYLE